MASFERRKLLLALLASLLLHLALALPFWGASEAARGDRPLGMLTSGGAARKLEATVGTLRSLPTAPAVSSESAEADRRSDRRQPSTGSRSGRSARSLEFFATDRLDSAPYPNEAIDLSSGTTQTRGKIELEIKVGEHGQVLGVTAINSEFDDDDTRWIEKTLQRTRFQPGIRRGEKVNSIVRMEILLSGSE
jgi:outer membrane biosynthesis protein TonB